MKALSLFDVEDARIVDVPEPTHLHGNILLRVKMVGLCGTDLNSFRGRNPLITYPRVLGHEIAATVLKGNDIIAEGTHVTVSPYTDCGLCPSCRRGRENACSNNQTFGVQRDGAITELLSVSPSKVYPSTLAIKCLCPVEPLTVGFHAVARGRVTATDTVAVFGCGGIGLGAISGAAFRGARAFAIDVDDEKLETARLAGATDLIHSSREDLRVRLRELFANCVTAAHHLGIDKDFSAKLTRAATRLLPYTTGSHGQLQEWSIDFAESTPGQRHMSHLYPLFPGSQITPRATPELARAARVSLDRRLTAGGAYTGWSRAWAINFWASLGDGTRVWESLAMLMQHSTNRNFFDTHHRITSCFACGVAKRPRSRLACTRRFDFRYGMVGRYPENLLHHTRPCRAVQPALTNRAVNHGYQVLLNT